MKHCVDLPVVTPDLVILRSVNPQYYIAVCSNIYNVLPLKYSIETKCINLCHILYEFIANKFSIKTTSVVCVMLRSYVGNVLFTQALSAVLFSFFSTLTLSYFCYLKGKKK